MEFGVLGIKLRSNVCNAHILLPYHSGTKKVCSEMLGDTGIDTQSRSSQEKEGSRQIAEREADWERRVDWAGQWRLLSRKTNLNHTRLVDLS